MLKNYEKKIKDKEMEIEKLQMELAGLQAELGVVDKWKARRFDKRFEHYEFPWDELRYQERAILHKMLKRNKKICDLCADITSIKKAMKKSKKG